MHKVKSFARSKAHAHGFNPWSNEEGQQAPGTLELSPTQSLTTAPARRGSTSAGPSSDPNNIRNVISESTGRRKASPDTRRPSAVSKKLPKEHRIATAGTVGSVHTERTVHFTPGDRSNNTENVGEPPDNPQETTKPSLLKRFNKTFLQILFHSWINVLLVFVPIGIAVEVAHMDPTIIFAMNCVALIPLAGMLSYATESVAHRLGDTIGALMNVTFGNAVELIVFIIALSKDEISVVQASIIGSILSNLLLILGMSFLLGGLRFREQIYNSTVTQMSACLLSISVLSLLLPTAFHASFSNDELADIATLKISRGTSVILLVIYIMYLLFQLRSHAYLYASIPQHVIDEESRPGILHHLGSSSSSSSSSSRRSSVSSSSSSSSGGFARSIRDRLRRMSHPDQEGKNSTRSSATSNPPHPSTHQQDEERRGRPMINEKPALPVIDRPTNDDDIAVFDGDEHHHHHHHHHHHSNGDGPSGNNGHQEVDEIKENPELTKAKLSLRAMTPKLFSRSGASPTPTPIAIAPGLVAEQTPRPLARRATSLPPRLTEEVSARDMLPYMIPLNISDASLDQSKEKQIISRTSAIILLLGSTGLVAVCAEFMVSSIDSVIISTGISEAFVGLILLPIVGNAAEHVTAVTVAAKNKMDLAIGVAVGSSIQIALFVTPLIVLLGWILDKDMGLYFNIFETVALFTSCFIVNFLVLDGRSNYLEGALLCASYIIIAVAAFFYPNDEQRSSIGAGPN